MIELVELCLAIRGLGLRFCDFLVGQDFDQGAAREYAKLDQTADR